MSEQSKSGAEDLVSLHQQFWQDWWTSIAGASTAAGPWDKPASLGGGWFKQPGDTAPSELMDALASQGEAFLRLCEQAGGGQADWLDRWLEVIQKTASVHSDGAPEYLSSSMMPAMKLLETPALGYSREGQAKYQAFTQAKLEWQQVNNRHLVLLAQLPADTAGRLRNRLATLEEQPGQRVDSLRGLYDLWVDAAEEAYAELVFSDEYRAVYGELINATMRCRKTAAALMEPQLKTLGIPTRSELDATTRQLHELRREVSELKASLSPAKPVKKTPRKKAAKRTKKKVKSS